MSLLEQVTDRSLQDPYKSANPPDSNDGMNGASGFSSNHSYSVGRSASTSADPSDAMQAFVEADSEPRHGASRRNKPKMSKIFANQTQQTPSVTYSHSTSTTAPKEVKRQQLGLAIDSQVEAISGWLIAGRISSKNAIPWIKLLPFLEGKMNRLVGESDHTLFLVQYMQLLRAPEKPDNHFKYLFDNVVKLLLENIGIQRSEASHYLLYCITSALATETNAQGKELLTRIQKQLQNGLEKDFGKPSLVSTRLVTSEKINQLEMVKHHLTREFKEASYSVPAYDLVQEVVGQIVNYCNEPTSDEIADYERKTGSLNDAASKDDVISYLLCTRLRDIHGGDDHIPLMVILNTIASSIQNKGAQSAEAIVYYGLLSSYLLDPNDVDSYDYELYDSVKAVLCKLANKEAIYLDHPKILLSLVIITGISVVPEVRQAAHSLAGPMSPMPISAPSPVVDRTNKVREVALGYFRGCYEQFCGALGSTAEAISRRLYGQSIITQDERDEVLSARINGKKGSEILIPQVMNKLEFSEDPIEVLEVLANKIYEEACTRHIAKSLFQLIKKVKEIQSQPPVRQQLVELNRVLKKVTVSQMRDGFRGISFDFTVAIQSISLPFANAMIAQGIISEHVRDNIQALGRSSFDKANQVQDAISRYLIPQDHTEGAQAMDKVFCCCFEQLPESTAAKLCKDFVTAMKVSAEGSRWN